MKQRAKKTPQMPAVSVLLETAIKGVKVDRGNRAALRKLANFYNLPMDTIITISPKNAKVGNVRKDGKQTTNGAHYNFGEIAECIMRLANGQSGEKQARGASDLVIDGVRYELKATNPDGKPAQTKGLDPKTPTLIFANLPSFPLGIYKIPYGEIVWNNSKTPHMVNTPTIAKAKLVQAIK